MPAKAEISAEQPTLPKLEKKKSKPKIVKQETSINGVLLRVEEGAKITLPPKTLKSFLRLGFEIATKYAATQELSSEVEDFKDRIVKIAKKIPGLRGFINEGSGYQITITKEKTRKLNRDIVKSALPPETYNALAREKWKGTLNVPTGLVNPEEVSQAITDALINLGISEKALPTIFEQEIEPDIDMDELDRLVASGQVTLPPGAITEGVEWKVTPKILDPKLFT